MNRADVCKRAVGPLAAGALLFVTLCVGASSMHPGTSLFTDPADGWFDVSEFLDSAYGFVPFGSPITEPAVGYGGVGALIFIDRNVPGQGQRYARPNVAAIGGLATENGTTGLFAGHLGNWGDGRFRTLAGFADADVNLEFFGLGGDRGPGNGGLDYTIAARGGVTGGSHRLGAGPLWPGLRYALVDTNVSLGVETAATGLEIPREDRDLRLAALTPSLTLDTRDNLFTPTRGSYLDLSVAVFREALGGDRNFETLNLAAMHYRSLADSIFLGLRATAKASSDGTPFFLRPFVYIRGVQALRYQGEQSAEFEAEMRWQLHPRFSVVGFGGAGLARGESGLIDRDKEVCAGGAGFRYLIARKHGLHMGLDVAAGPDDPILYVVFGSAWLRP